MSMSFKASPDGTFGEILVNGAVVAKLPVSGNAVIPGLVGTVSQSGGIPTGAVIERGSNANGEYVRFADGTQICTRSKVVNGTIAAGSVTAFDNAVSAAFVGVPFVYFSGAMFSGANATGDAIYTLNVVSAAEALLTKPSYMFCTGMRPSSVAFSYSVGSTNAASKVEQMIAVGRWF